MNGLKKIVLIVDASADPASAVSRATTLAKNQQAALTVCRVVTAAPERARTLAPGATPSALREIAVTEAQDQLQALAAGIAEADIPVETSVLVGRPHVEIVRLVLAQGYDLVMKTAEAPVGLRDMLFGSTDMNLMRHCPCPVWIMKPTGQPPCRRILVAVDEEPEGAVKDALNHQLLEMATALALAEFSEIHVAHAWNFFGEHLLRTGRSQFSDAEVDAMVAAEEQGARSWLEDVVDGVAKDNEVRDYLAPQLHLLKGQPDAVLPELVRKLAVDLLVMGTVGRTGIPGFFMGNTAERIITQVDCAVLTLKPAGFVSPVRPGV